MFRGRSPRRKNLDFRAHIWQFRDAHLERYYGIKNLLFQIWKFPLTKGPVFLCSNSMYPYSPLPYHLGHWGYTRYQIEETIETHFKDFWKFLPHTPSHIFWENFIVENSTPYTPTYSKMIIEKDCLSTIPITH